MPAPAPTNLLSPTLISRSFSLDACASVPGASTGSRRDTEAAATQTRDTDTDTRYCTDAAPSRDPPLSSAAARATDGQHVMSDRRAARPGPRHPSGQVGHAGTDRRNPDRPPLGRLRGPGRAGKSDGGAPYQGL